MGNIHWNGQSYVMVNTYKPPFIVPNEKNRQIRVKHLELTLGYMGKFFNKGVMTTKFHILNVQEGLGRHAKDGRCASSRNQEIRRHLSN